MMKSHPNDDQLCGLLMLYDAPFTRYNRFDNRLDVCLHDTASCQTGLYKRFDNRVEGTATVCSTDSQTA